MHPVTSTPYCPRLPPGIQYFIDRNAEYRGCRQEQLALLPPKVDFHQSIASACHIGLPHPSLRIVECPTETFSNGF